MPRFETFELAVGLLAARRSIRTEFSVDRLDRRYEQHDDNSSGRTGTAKRITRPQDNDDPARHHPARWHITCAVPA
ncbi:hypothetical protein [Salinisphaera sp.]|uniref:hypothetical protein n=1 Tax=Salinisphaera sp. TaxID=1914330 RepID=UPI000C6BC793|nr:hypothetical protein [Salinisphaera sp.]MBS64538.1 hypothetical protein [Salinisphaera sp.]